MYIQQVKKRRSLTTLTDLEATEDLNTLIYNYTVKWKRLTYYAVVFVSNTPFLPPFPPITVSMLKVQYYGFLSYSFYPLYRR